MKPLQLVTLSHGGKPFYVYATDSEPFSANYDAGALMDRLTDNHGEGFSYAVTPLLYRPGTWLHLLDDAQSAYEKDAWNPLNLECP